MMSGFGWRSTIGLAAVAVLVGGCSSFPDAANPIKWYEYTVEALTGEDEDDKVAAQAKPAPGGDKEFPNLATVPPKPTVAPRQERQQVAEGLVADTERRRYASSVSRQGEAKNVLSDMPAKPAEPALKPQSISAVPKLPVTPAPVAPAKKVAAAPVLKPAPMPASPKAPGIALQPPPMPTVAAARPTAVAPRATKPFLPANSQMPGSDGDFQTIVISSAGVDSGTAAARAPSAAKRAPLKFGISSAQPSAGAPRGETLRIATIQFANGSAGLDARDRSILRNVLALQRERGGVIEVVGHASSRTANMDSVRHKMVNFQISENRATTVARTLMKFGAQSNDIVVTAKSDLEPMYFEFMPSGEAGNRRVEVFLTF
ncbi:MAG: OmpA family protein [Rhodospirillales bacterium]|nr:OmpA family protein [Rhodospirillales bacterium]